MIGTVAELDAKELLIALWARAFAEERLVIALREWRSISVARAVDRLGELRRLDCSPPERGG